MTPATITYNETFCSSFPAVLMQNTWRTDTTSEEEELFNCYGAALHEKRKQPENDSTKIPEANTSPCGIERKNLELVKFLDEWFAESDDLGEEFWKEYCKDLEKNRFTI